MENLTPAHHAAAGALAGVVEISCSQPTITIKNALQDGRTPTMTPRALYTGWGAGAASIAPITAVQFGANRFYGGLARDAGLSDNVATRMSTAALAGITSGAVAGPFEAVVIQQQKVGGGILETAKRLVNERGVSRGLFRGISMTCVREGLYTMGYLGIAPAIKDALLEQGWSESSAFGTSAVTGGLIACVLTHPSDTIKTRMQANMDVEEKPQYRSSLSTMRHVLGEGGLAGFFSGAAPRALRLVGAVFILNMSKEKIMEGMVAAGMGDKAGEGGAQPVAAVAADRA
ncbi:unnamed protein product [Pedinophyceae sp. YPF-701]|nr:unnamed protein product [Pedinophyceae sp. YPF-701]